MSNLLLRFVPDIELVQILLLLADRPEKTCQVLQNNGYIRRVRGHFGPFADHEAVRLTAELVENSHFFHSRPVKAALRLGEIRGSARDPLYAWGAAVRDFERAADFAEFYESCRDLHGAVTGALRPVLRPEWIGFIEAFFKDTLGGYHYVPCTLAGNYGFLINGCGYVVAFHPLPERGELPACISPAWVAHGIAHEFCHCFVNPTVESHADRLEPMDAFFGAHTRVPSAYNVRYAVINEYFARAFAVLFMRHFGEQFPDFNMETELARQRDMFPFFVRFLELLPRFGEGYKTLPEAYPGMLREIAGWAERE